MFKNKDFWLSGKDVHGEGRFVWFGEGHGESLGYTHFRPHAESPQRDKDCLAIDKERKWFGDCCDKLKPYLCEYYGDEEPAVDF